MKRVLFIIAICLTILACQPVYAQTDSANNSVTEQVAAPAQDQDTIASAPVQEIKQSNVATKIEKVQAKAKTAKTKEERAKALEKNDEYGFTLTIMSMCVVLGALIILSILFMIFGKISMSLLHRKKLAAKGINHKESTMTKEDLAPGEVIAAIAMALHDHFNAHDQEHYDLTIKRMKRAYSPWNSKIYNMREVPVLRKFFK